MSNIWILCGPLLSSTSASLCTLCFAVGKHSGCVFCSLSWLISHSCCEKLWRPELCLHWQNSGLLLCGALYCTSSDLSWKKKREPFEVRGINWVRGPRRMSYYLVGRRQLKWHLKLTAMVNDLLGIRMPHQPLICAGRRSYSLYSVHEISTSLFQRLNYRFTSEICFLKYCPRMCANRSIPNTILVND